MNNKYEYIDKTLQGLNQSSEAHFEWLVKIISFVAQQGADRDLPEIRYCDSHNICAFGKWLNGILKEERDDRSFLEEIQHQHINVHQICRRIVEDIDGGRPLAPTLSAFQEALLRFNASLNKYKTHLLQLRTSYDTLTGVPLRRILDESFNTVVKRHSDSGAYLLLLDVDHFKKVNDNYGHLTGDEVLHALAMMLEKNVRKYEPVYRYGGEEFIMLIYAVNEKEACAIAERVRKYVCDTPVRANGYDIRITFTAGLTRIHQGEILREVMERADTALYAGKQSGRNRCIFIDKAQRQRRILS